MFTHPSSSPPYTSQSSASWRAASISSTSSFSAMKYWLITKIFWMLFRCLKKFSKTIYPFSLTNLEMGFLHPDKQQIYLAIFTLFSYTLHFLLSFLYSIQSLRRTDHCKFRSENQPYSYLPINHLSRLTVVVITSRWHCIRSFDKPFLLRHQQVKETELWGFSF
jgi:hypothetical protein